MKSNSFFSYNLSNLSLMPRRTQSSNKSTYGRLLCVCGSEGMAGAAFLCAKAALRTGAGLVEILTPKENRLPLQSMLPEAIITVYDSSDPEDAVVDNALSRADAIAIGCGLGITPQSRKIVAKVLKNSAVPTVVDADALNLISRNRSLYKYIKGKIITPHPLEMSRLTDIPVDSILADTQSVCRDFASRAGLVCVLKDHRTVVSDGGERIYLNNTGNSGMATSGSGDVLTGIIGGILAQNKNACLTTFEVATLGVYIHGLCGDSAAAALGEYSVIASDIIACLPKILKTI